jgi:hypothetical protein
MLKTMLFVYRMAGSKKMTFKVISSYLIFLTCTDAYMKCSQFVCLFITMPRVTTECPQENRDAHLIKNKSLYLL